MWKWRRRREAQRVRDHSLSPETHSGARLTREIEAFLAEVLCELVRRQFDRARITLVARNDQPGHVHIEIR